MPDEDEDEDEGVTRRVDLAPENEPTLITQRVISKSTIASPAVMDEDHTTPGKSMFARESESKTTVENGQDILDSLPSTQAETEEVSGNNGRVLASTNELSAKCEQRRPLEEEVGLEALCDPMDQMVERQLADEPVRQAQVMTDLSEGPCPLRRQAAVVVHGRPGAYSISPYGAYTNTRREESSQVSERGRRATNCIIVQGMLVNEDSDGDLGRDIDPSSVDRLLQRMVRESQIAEVTGVGPARPSPRHQEDASLSRTKSSPRADRFARRFCCRLGFFLFVITVVAVVVSITCAPHRGDKIKAKDEAHNLSPRKNATNRPTAKKEEIPVATFGDAFTSTEELYSAIDGYLHDYSPNSSIAVKYGYPIGSWNVSLLSNFSHLFSTFRNPNANYFNEDLNHWDVSRATTLEGMFWGATGFNCSNLSSWDVSHVVHMDSLFRRALSFNADISSWRVRHVVSMDYMFYRAKSFSSDISSWDTSSVTSMANMFEGADNFQGDLSQWNTTAVAYMSFMFQFASQFDGDLSGWDLSNVRSIVHMFQEAISFQSDLSSWNVASVSDMSFAFDQAGAFNSDLSRWNVSGVSEMRFMFRDASSFNQNLCSWGRSISNNSKVVVEGMFLGSGCPVEDDPVFGSVPSAGSFCHRCQP